MERGIRGVEQGRRRAGGIDVVGIGENSVDYVYRVAAYPRPEPALAKQRVLSRRVSPGGQVATTVCTCAAFGLRASYVGAFGNDEAAEVIRRALDERHVDTGSAVVREAPNRHAVILVADEGGERIVLWERDPRLVVQPSELDAGLLRSARLVHIDAVDAPLARQAALVARAAGRPVTSDIDTITDDTAALLESVTIPILAEHALTGLTGERDPERGLRALRRRHDGLLCVTLGAEGAMLLEGDRLHHHPGYRVPVVDTTAAGDIFRGAFIHGLLRGDPPDVILRMANAAAALGCTREGAITAIPAPADVAALAAQDA